MICASCSFETDRLAVREWHAPADDAWPIQDLPQIVTAVMTRPVTRSLPPDWQGPFTEQRAVEWIAQRDGEGPTLVAAHRASGEAVGLVVLFESTARDNAGTDVRLGYVVAENWWGQGLATELVAGFVGWCRARPAVASVACGVDRTHVSSQRVLEKNGFVLVDPDHGGGASELFYTRRFTRG